MFRHWGAILRKFSEQRNINATRSPKYYIVRIETFTMLKFYNIFKKTDKHKNCSTEILKLYDSEQFHV